MKARGKKPTGSDTNAAALAYYCEEPRPDSVLESDWAELSFFEDGPELWAKARAAVLKRYMRMRPGYRPQRWWQTDAPEPLRRQVGGSGRMVSSFGAWHGLPASMADVREHLPPMFESEPAFLRRHDLLSHAERRRLPSDAFEAVAYPFGTLLAGGAAQLRRQPR